RLAGGWVAAQGEEVSHAAVQQRADVLAEVLSAGPDAGQVRQRGDAGGGEDLLDQLPGGGPGGPGGAVGDREEVRLCLRERGDGPADGLLTARGAWRVQLERDARPAPGRVEQGGCAHRRPHGKQHACMIDSIEPGGSTLPRGRLPLRGCCGVVEPGLSAALDGVSPMVPALRRRETSSHMMRSRTAFGTSCVCPHRALSYLGCTLGATGSERST